MNSKESILLSIFITALICANLLGNKIITLFGVTTSVGIFAVPLTFLVTDIIEETYGKKETKKFVIAGIIALIISFILVAISRAMPPASFYSQNEAYNNIFGNSLRNNTCKPYRLHNRPVSRHMGF
ncbi:MAG: queuosine precursor transporter [Candidatus Woesearchaeota archaeon]